MPRFLLVRGRQGVLVTNPHAIGASPMRVAGQRLRTDAPKGPLHTLFEPCDEVLLEHGDLLAAAKAGDIDLLARVVADDHTAARAQMAPPMPALPPTVSTSTTKSGKASTPAAES